MRRDDVLFLRLSRVEADALLNQLGSSEYGGPLGLLRARLLAAKLRADRVPEIDWPVELQELA